MPKTKNIQKSYKKSSKIKTNIKHQKKKKIRTLFALWTNIVLTTHKRFICLIKVMFFWCFFNFFWNVVKKFCFLIKIEIKLTTVVQNKKNQPKKTPKLKWNLSKRTKKRKRTYSWNCVFGLSFNTSYINTKYVE
jgi:hypothetical protein